jgi:hypothetical protein
MPARGFAAMSPALFVLFLVTCCGIINIVYSVPSLARRHRAYWLFNVSNLVFYSMFVWCWLHAAAADPGRVRDDLESRGILSRTVNGDIPHCLRALPICTFCHLPYPPDAGHCSVCRECVLRHDHHCEVIGNCIGDKNLKAFVLSFIYAFLFSVSNSISGFVRIADRTDTTNETGVMVSSAYLLLVGFVLLAFGWSFASGGIDTVRKRVADEKSVWKKFLKTFGESWWQRIIPIQSETTFFAWKGVNWALSDGISRPSLSQNV